jgi:hypothetical protein
MSPLAATLRCGKGAVSQRRLLAQGRTDERTTNQRERERAERERERERAEREREREREERERDPRSCNVRLHSIMGPGNFKTYFFRYSAYWTFKITY